MISELSYKKSNIGYSMRIADIIFFMSYGLYLIKSLIKTSTIEEFIPIRGYTNTFVIIVVAILLVIKIIGYTKYSKKEIVCISTIFLLLVPHFIMMKHYDVSIVLLFIVAAKNIDYKKIVKFFFYITGFCVLLFFCLSLMSIIENYNKFSLERGNRYAFGNLYATDFAAMIFYLQMAYTYIYYKKFTIRYVVFWSVLALLIYQYTDARLDLYLIITFSISIYIYSKYQKILYFRVVKFLNICSYIILSAIAIYIQYIYTSLDMTFYNLNKILSNRLYLGHQSLVEYGVNLYGHKIRLQGNGWGSTQDILIRYNFIDSGYLNVLILEGAILAIILILYHTLMIKYLYSKKDSILIIVLVFVGITSMIDHHILQLAYNPFILAGYYCFKSDNLTSLEQ